MTSIVNEELKHITSTGYYDAQAELRMVYNAARRHDLKLRKTKEETLSHCIEVVKKDHLDWQPAYDRSFFNLP